jgi:hypothetical protein
VVQSARSPYKINWVIEFCGSRRREGSGWLQMHAVSALQHAEVVPSASNLRSEPVFYLR